MANSDKNISIIPNRSLTGQPQIIFTGQGNDPITLKVLDSTIGSLSFEGSAGQLLSITDSLSSGSIFSVNDISGMPSIDVNADGTIALAPFSGNIAIGVTSASFKLHVNGTLYTASAATFNSNVILSNGNLQTTTSTFNLITNTASTINIGTTSGSTISIASTTGTTTVNNSAIITGNLTVNGGTITSTATTFNLLNTTVTNANVLGAADTILIGSAGGSTTIRNAATRVNGTLTVAGVSVHQGAGAFNSTLSVTGTSTLIGDVTASGDIAVNGGDITSTATTFNLLNATVTGLNVGGAANTVLLGGTGGTTTIRNAGTNINGTLTVTGVSVHQGAGTFNSTLSVTGVTTLQGASTLQGAVNMNSTLTVTGVSVHQGAGAFNSTLTVTGVTTLQGASTLQSAVNMNSTLTVTGVSVHQGAGAFNSTLSVTGTSTLIGDVTASGDIAVNGGDITSTATTFNLLNATVTNANVLGAANTVVIGGTGGTATVRNAGTNINGTLTVTGTSTFIGDVIVRSGDIETTSSVFSFVTNTASTINIGTISGSTIAIGNASGTTTIRNASTNINGTLTVSGNATFLGSALYTDTILAIGNQINIANAAGGRIAFGDYDGAGNSTYVFIRDATSSLLISNPYGDVGIGDPNNVDSGYALLYNAAAGYLDGGNSSLTNFGPGSFNGLLTASAGISVSGATAAIFNGTVSCNSNTIYKPTLQYYNEVLASPAITANVLTLDLSTAQMFTVSLNANITTFTITNTPATANRSIGFTLIFTADGTARTVTWGAAVKWANNDPPALTSANGKKDILSFVSPDGGTNWYGFIGGLNF